MQKNATPELTAMAPSPKMSFRSHGSESCSPERLVLNAMAPCLKLALAHNASGKFVRADLRPGKGIYRHN